MLKVKLIGGQIGKAKRDQNIQDAKLVESEGRRKGERRRLPSVS